nr:hypothetical protein [Nocardioides ungokensis]
MHGRLRAHPRLRAGRPAHPGAGGRVPAVVRPAAGAGPRGPGDDRRHGRAGGLRGGEVPHARQADGRARRDPAHRRRLPRGVRPQLRRAAQALPARRRRDRRRRPRLGARHDRGGRRRPADEGVPVGVLGITCFRPWPVAEVREALSQATRVVVVEKAFAVGAGGIVGQNTRDATRGLPVEVYDVVAGLGGRPVTRASLRGLLDDVLAGRVDPQRLHFLDLDLALVQRELERSRRGKRPGPHAEHMLRDIGTVASGAYE